MGKIRVMLVDDHTLFRQGIRVLLESQDDIEVVGEAGAGDEVLEKAQQCQPDIILMDITLKGMDGLVVTRAILKELPETKVLIVTMHSGQGYFFRALEAGASGYVLKEAAFIDVITAVRAVYQGGVFLYPSLAGRLVDDYLHRVATGEEKESYEKLTERERQILSLIAKGHTNQEIADILVLSPNTVQTHRSHIMEKLNLQSKAQLMKYAIRMGLLPSTGDSLHSSY